MRHGKQGASCKPLVIQPITACSFVLVSSILWNGCTSTGIQPRLHKTWLTTASARDVFTDPFALEWLDDREDYGEDRYVIIGMVEARLLYIAYTVRGDVMRVISARGAEPHERRRYHEEDG